MDKSHQCPKRNITGITHINYKPETAGKIANNERRDGIPQEIIAFTNEATEGGFE